MSLPYFKYHPDPIATGMFERTTAICPCCEQSTEYVYATQPYGVEDVEDLCPNCIASGLAATKFDVVFSDICPLIEAGLKQEIIDEIELRTPGFIAWQQEEWLTCCDDVCEFHGDLQKDELLQLPPAVIEKLRKKSGINEKDWQEIASDYIPESSPAIYKFVCRHCQTIQLGLDYN
ncbi:MAG: CbrC family protein [Chthoniobacterales bacterium]